MQGLSTKRIDALQKQYGLNVLKDDSGISFLHLFWEQLTAVFTLLLLLAATFSFFAGDAVEAFLILGIIILNVSVGVFQEYKAEESVKMLRQYAVSVVRVVRDGQQQEIKSTHLLPGDVVYLEEGSKVPADAVLLEATNLEINESVLTGESLPLPKVKDEKIFMGTIISRGHTYARVEAIGMSTKFGKIATNLMAVKRIKTPLQQKLTEISRMIGFAGIVVAFIVFGLSWWQGSSLQLSFLLAVSLAVAVVPEGLPAIMTVILGRGVKAMAAQKAIVRKFDAIEGLGSVTLIATDKTGTLTQNKMLVKDVYCTDKLYEKDKLKVENTDFERLLLISSLCSTASLVSVHGKQMDVLGDPTEGALLLLTQEVGRSYEQFRQDWKIDDELTFDSETKRMSVRASLKKERLILTKGAPESIFEVSTHMLSGGRVRKITSADREQANKMLHAWAKAGYRVLGFAYSNVSKAHDEPIEHQVKDMVFVGMMALYDPPRPEVSAAIERARGAGIEVVMITGDNEETAESISSQIGLLRKGELILTGKQVEKYSDERLIEILPKVRAFARTTPRLKSRIVSLYQKMGEIVVVTGDGVNDAIALKQANVGIAMGLEGTDVARETADIVLTDDNFATIVNAIEQGRHIMGKLKSTLTYLFTGNFSEATTLVAALLLGVRELYFPIQLLYINLISDGMPALSIGFSPRSSNLMKQKPKKGIVVLDSFDKKYIFGIGLLGTFIIITTFLIVRATLGYEVARTAAFIMLPISQAFMFTVVWLNYRAPFTNLKNLLRPMFLVGFLGPFVGQGLINYIPSLSHIFHIESVSPTLFFAFVLIASLNMLVFSALQFVRGKG